MYRDINAYPDPLRCSPVRIINAHTGEHGVDAAGKCKLRYISVGTRCCAAHHDSTGHTLKGHRSILSLTLGGAANNDHQFTARGGAHGGSVL